MVTTYRCGIHDREMVNNGDFVYCPDCNNEVKFKPHSDSTTFTTELW